MRKLDLVFTGDGADLTFVEAEVDGKSIKIGEWTKDSKGYYRLTITEKDWASLPVTFAPLGYVGGKDGS